MSADTLVFWIILAVNTLITAVYLIVSLCRKRPTPGLAARCVAMLLFPVIGLAYFAVGWVLRKLFFHKPVELSDVIFSKEREKTLLKADVESESGIVPVGDAVTIVDKQNARTAMLEVLSHDVRNSLSSIFVALDSNDSEISHYAASMLQSELGKFRVGVQKIVEEIDRTEAELRDAEDYDGQKKTPAGIAFSGEDTAAEATPAPEEVSDVPRSGDPAEKRRKEEQPESAANRDSEPGGLENYSRREQTAHEQGLRAYYGTAGNEQSLDEKLSAQVGAAHELIENLHVVLRQKVLPEMESTQFTELTDRMARLLKKRDVLSAEELSQVAECWLLRGDLEKCGEWSDYLSLVYPEALEAYSTQLKLLYETGERCRFAECLDRLKKSGIPLDSEMMELVRVFH